MIQKSLSRVSNGNHQLKKPWTWSKSSFICSTKINYLQTLKLLIPRERESNFQVSQITICCNCCFVLGIAANLSKQIWPLMKIWFAIHCDWIISMMGLTKILFKLILWTDQFTFTNMKKDLLYTGPKGMNNDVWRSGIHYLVIKHSSILFYINPNLTFPNQKDFKSTVYP